MKHIKNNNNGQRIFQSHQRRAGFFANKHQHQRKKNENNNSKQDRLQQHINDMNGINNNNNNNNHNVNPHRKQSVISNTNIHHLPQHQHTKLRKNNVNDVNHRNNKNKKRNNNNKNNSLSQHQHSNYINHTNNNNNNRSMNQSVITINNNHQLQQQHNNIIQFNSIQQPQDIIPSAIIADCEFKFDLKYQQKDSRTRINVDYAVRIRGTVNEDRQFQIWRKVKGVDKKEMTLSPSWLLRHPEEIAKGILMKLFKMRQQEVTKLSKKESVSLCYEKFNMTKANRKLKEKQLMMFTEEEIKIIIQNINEKYNVCDLRTELFNYHASIEMWLKDEEFMDILDDLLRHKLFETALKNIYDKLLHILLTKKTDTKFDVEFAAFHRDRMKTKSLKHLISIFDELISNKNRTYNVNATLLSSVFVFTIKVIFLKHLTNIVYNLLENNLKCKIDNSISNEKAGSYGGSSLCSCFRISYSRKLSEEKRQKLVALQRNLLCKENERDMIPLELQFENMGGMYMLSPSLYPFCQRILSDLLTKMNKHIILPSHGLPEFDKIIQKYIDNQSNIEEFKAFFSLKDLSENNDLISGLYKRFVKFMCGKLIWSILKQQQWTEVGMSIRDQFNFGHMKHVKNKNKTNK